MSKERELLKRAMNCLLYADGENVITLSAEIQSFLDAEPEAEPVAWMHVYRTHKEPNLFPLLTHECEAKGLSQYPLYTKPAEPEAVRHGPASEEDMKVYKAIADGYAKPTEKEADDILNRAITALESTALEIANIAAFRDRVIDECIEAVGLGICRDGRNTSHYQQSQRHLEALRKLKTNPSPAREPMTEEEIDVGFNPYRTRWLSDDQYFVAGVRWAEKHHGIGGDDE